MVKLVIADDTGATTVVPLVRDEISIGRAEGNTIRLTERNISRRHASLRRVGETHVLKDMGSYNGVVLNGQRVDGETPIKPGDLIQIGDYVIVVKPDKEEDAPGVAIEQEGITLEMVPAALTPARLVMLSEPTPGAEFSLSLDGLTRIGRSESLEVPIDHRSVSREHASVQAENGYFRLVDNDSVNGIRVNGKTLNETLLQSGDIIEMGEVVFRYVAQGEAYVFDRAEAARYVRRFPRFSAKSFRIAAAVVAGVVALIVIVRWAREDDTTTVTSLGPEPSSAAGEVSTRAATAADDEAFSTSLAACQAAIGGDRFAEAIAHAARALEIRPSDRAARGCKATAERYHEQEQVFVRGKAAFERGDMPGAYREFAQLDKDSPFRQRSEVVNATTQLARSRIDRARAFLNTDAERAIQLADHVLQMGDAPVELHGAARDIEEMARQKILDRAAARTQAARRTVQRGRRASAAAPAPKQPETAPSPEPPPRATAALPPGGTPLQAASACLARGDNRCVIRALAGRARTAQELGLLIETYRSMGDTKRAMKNMALYVKRFPTGSRTPMYQKILERSGH